MSTSEYKKKREIEEARKNGSLPPEKDEEGKLINPHNPEFISKRPWYLGDSGPSLKHQGIQKSDHLLSITEADQLYVRGKKKKAATKWRKGACKNCGAMSHKTIECVERPRARGAWKTNKDIQQDEVIIDVRSEKYGKLSFDAKRDQWLGYNPKQHQETIERYEQVEAERRKSKMEEMNKNLSVDGNSSKKGKKVVADDSDDSDYDSDELDNEEFKDKEGGRVISERVARQGGVGGAEMKTTVRNLRIREDTAKYLRNLNPNSAYYDPKTRSMRDNPTPDVNPDDLVYAGDNFVRCSGDAKELAKTQVFAWEAQNKGSHLLHPVANPSQAEFMRQEFEKKKSQLEATKKEHIISKYGSQDHLAMPSSELLVAQSEQYVEYTRDGRVLKGKEKGTVKSKYIEDQLEMNHTSIWGSYFDVKEMAWGYACCHSKIRKSYCTGEAGKEANAIAVTEMTARAMLQPRKDSENNESSTSNEIKNKADLYGEQLAPVLDSKKLKKELKKQQKEHIELDDRKRSYNSHAADHEVDAETMEAYRMKKVRTEDPMSKFLGSDELLPNE